MSSLAPPTCTELLVAVAKRRDRDAFASLFRLYAPQIKRYLMSCGADAATADELIQEVMITVWRRAETFDPSRASGSTWLFTIARNKRIDVLRREKRPEVDPRDPAMVAAVERPADAVVDATRSCEAVRQAIERLPKEQAEVVEGAYFEDKSLATIATEAQVPLGTVKSRVRLALQRLRLAMGEDVP